jgi:hypothetical protein
MFVGNTCYGIDDRLNKIPIARFQGRPEDYRKVTIGIDVSKYSNETFPKNVSIYCSNPAFEHLDFTYKLLPYITVSSNGNPLFVKEGLTYYKNNQAEGYEQMFREQSIQNKIIEDIKVCIIINSLRFRTFNLIIFRTGTASRKSQLCRL